MSKIYLTLDDLEQLRLFVHALPDLDPDADGVILKGNMDGLKEMQSAYQVKEWDELS